jgi:hypothetical protein
MSDNEKSPAATNNKAGKTVNNGDGVVIRKTISPYDITSNDNPGSLITHVQLKGENYDEWSRSLRTALRARKKFGFVDGTIGRPDEGSSDLEDWWTNNSLLVSWIMNTIEPSLRSTMSHMEVAMDLWKDIKERFSIVNGPRIQQLKAELVECKQKGLTIVTYYGKLKKIVGRISELRPDSDMQVWAVYVQSQQCTYKETRGGENSSISHGIG